MTPRDRAGRVSVVVTGMGMRSPAGNSLEAAYQTVLSAKSRAGIVGELLRHEAPVQFACLTPPFNVGSRVGPWEQRKIDRATLLALCAAADALAEAALPEHIPRARIGVHLGTGVGGIPVMEDTMRQFGSAPLSMPVHTVLKAMANSAAGRIATRHGFEGSCVTYSTACASGTMAIGEAARRIQYGELDAAVSGGFDACVTPMLVSGFARMGILSRNTQPELASRPFDACRDGFVLGEGAAVLVLERRDAAEARGATIYGEVAGYAANCDAHHIVAPPRNGVVAARCMAHALADAGLEPSDVGHISAHGTSTGSGDAAEAAAIRNLFAEACPPVTAVKGVTGHLLAGSGALEAALALVCARRGLVPAVANLDLSPEADGLDLVTGTARTIPVAPVLSNSFGFGGHNACLVLDPGH
ncbi:beta-ketoacyl-[acyl-carrier-protein] synthase family protein [Streptomyces sp. NPDC005728]|uniref:beta-ketoacyl-[acyl-carrier-protein] synthase family protein n=1 Tax=Streptomyces sp. NPDC005728 TaxID=3157054 RepID=UPI003404BA28